MNKSAGFIIVALAIAYGYFIAHFDLYFISAVGVAAFLYVIYSKSDSSPKKLK